MPNISPADAPERARSQQNIAYVRQMLGELRAVAENERADMLCYLIEMAYIEAGDVVERLRRPVHPRFG